MSRYKPLAALAVVMATLAVAVPAASAGTAKTSPAVHTAAVRSTLVPGSLICRILRFYSRTGTPPLNGLALGAYFTIGCGGP
jgi:hypothetical protein